jgi:hypothetical protein
VLALAHDYRIMREDLGFMSFPPVNVAIPFTQGMPALISLKIPEALRTVKQRLYPEASAMLTPTP